MDTKDSIIAKGHFHLQVFENGMLVRTIDESNLVVTSGLQNMARIIGGHASGKKIEKISVGTSSLNPQLTDTAITDAFTKAITSVSYPDTQSVLFSFTIDSGEANGSGSFTIREFGLLNTDNVLCARKVRAGEIIKTSSIQLVGTWKLTFS